MNIEKRRQFIINFLYCFIIAAIIYVILKYGISLIFPFIFGFLVAYMLKKPIAFLSKKLHLKRPFAAIILVVIFYAIIVTIFSVISVKLFVAAKDFVFRLPQIYSKDIQPVISNIFDDIEEYASRIDPSLIASLEEVSSGFMQSISNLISNISVGMVTAVSGYASSLPVFIVKLLIAIIATFFIAVDYHTVSSFLLRQLSDKRRAMLLNIKNQLLTTLSGYGKSYALILGITFLELSLGLSIIGVKNAVYIAILIALLDILPVLGTGSVMIPWAVISLIQGNYPMAVKLLILYVAITVIRNVIEPRIVGNQVGLHPMATLFAMFVGTQLFGIIGLFGLPITLALLKNMNDKGLIHIFK